MHLETLKRILLAPVNMFFDVTPIGKILGIFSDDITVFYGRILDAPNHMMEMLSHVIVVLSIMGMICDWYIFVILGFMVYLMTKISTPYLYADNQLHKVASSLWTPIRSYFYESSRGTHIIRAFNQQDKIMARQHEMLD